MPYVGQKLPMSDLIDLPRIGTRVTMPQMQLKRAVGEDCREKHGSRFYTGWNYHGDECG